MELNVVKRDGSVVPLDQTKIQGRIEQVSEDLAVEYFNIPALVEEVVQGLYNYVTTANIDDLLINTLLDHTIDHPDIGLAAGRIGVLKLHHETNPDLLETFRAFRNYIHPATGSKAPLISQIVMDLMEEHHERLQREIEYTRSFQFDGFGLATLMKSYLLRLDGKVAERPQQMYMRVALGIHDDDIEAAIETYHHLSRGIFTHATPTLFNAGTCKPQMSSCFLLTMKEDSISGIFSTLGQCAEISKTAGGIGLSIHTIRARGSYVRGTNGESNGIIPMLQVFNSTAKYVDQGGGRRKGAFCIYLEPWHKDIQNFINARKHRGTKDLQVFDLFYALWIPDLFMRRVQANQTWSLFCPDDVRYAIPGGVELCDLYGEEFDRVYEELEQNPSIPRTTMPAMDLWYFIVDAQSETGGPNILFKDAVNRKSNQKNLGTIRSSNLCTEVVQYSSPDEVAVCNLASIALNQFVNEETKEYDYPRLQQVVRILVRNLDKVIDRTYYPVPEARVSNLRHRPMGIGIQGLADVFYMLDLPFDSEGARTVNRNIFESMYYAAMDESCRLADVKGPYETFAGSPASEGKFQFDLWDHAVDSSRYDWDDLKERVQRIGLRNSLLLAIMPTASTAQILRNTESIEPNRMNIFLRRVNSGEFSVVNRYLVKRLVELGLWTKEIRFKIAEHKGMIGNMEEIPEHIRNVFKTVWEIKQRALIDLAADRAPFICQTQSMNLYLSVPDRTKLTKLYFYAWRKGLKTGQYYFRDLPKAEVLDMTMYSTTTSTSTSTATGAGAGANAERPEEDDEEKDSKEDQIRRPQSLNLRRLLVDNEYECQDCSS